LPRGKVCDSCAELPRILAAPPDVLSSRMVGLIGSLAESPDNAREAAALPGFSLVGRVVGGYTAPLARADEAIE
jgi:hypothetical protein